MRLLGRRDAVRCQEMVCEWIHFRARQLTGCGAGSKSRGTEAKQKLDSALASLTDLKEKLNVVVDKLKAGGIDVSKYTALLGGE